MGREPDAGLGLGLGLEETAFVVAAPANAMNEDVSGDVTVQQQPVDALDAGQLSLSACVPPSAASEAPCEDSSGYRHISVWWAGSHAWLPSMSKVTGMPGARPERERQEAPAPREVLEEGDGGGWRGGGGRPKSVCTNNGPARSSRL